VFCENTEQQRHLVKEYKLRMTDEDCIDQKGPRVAKYLNKPLPLTPSDKTFINSFSSAGPSKMETDSAAHNIPSEVESICTDSSQSSVALESVRESVKATVQNRKKW